MFFGDILYYNSRIIYKHAVGFPFCNLFAKWGLLPL
jgi:hypothetical protein